MELCDIGLIGLAVMGENLILNMESHGFSVAVFNRTTSKVDDFIHGRAKGKRIKGTYSLPELVKSLKRPRKIMMMVKAGKAVDELIEQLIPLLQEGDILIDGGNSYFKDTIRRTLYVESKGLLYIGTGVREVKKERCAVRRSCPVVRKKLGRMSNLFFKALPPKWPMVLPAVNGLAVTEPDIL